MSIIPSNPGMNRGFSISGPSSEVLVSPSLILAPMSGVTNSYFRRLIRRENPGAVGLVVTEFVSIEGLTRDNLRSIEMMRFHEEERPISIQIFGHDIARMVDAAQRAQDAGAEVVDINSGCPVPRVVRRGGGCELMRQPEHLGSMLKAVRKVLSVPLTLKIRAGWDESSRNCVEIARIAEASGVSMLAVHGRTRSQQYRGLADWNIIREVSESVKIPVVGSGDVTDLASARERIAAGVSGLMIGRAALSNPWIFSEIRAGLAGESFPRPSDLKTVDLLEDYLELMLDGFPSKAIMGRMKQLISQVTRRVRGSSQVRLKLCRLNDVSALRQGLAEWRSELACRGQDGVSRAHSAPPSGAGYDAHERMAEC